MGVTHNNATWERKSGRQRFGWVTAKTGKPKIKATRFAISEVPERIETLPGTTTVTDHSPDS